MKANIHPKSHKTTVKCASCQNSFETITTKSGTEMVIDICSNCHPFYIGAKSGATSMKGRAEKLSGKFESGKATISTKAKKEGPRVKKNKNQALDSFEKLNSK